MVVWGGLELSKDVLYLRLDHMLTNGEKRPRGKFYRSPMVDAKCTYQNLKLTNVRVDVAWMGSIISNIKL